MCFFNLVPYVFVLWHLRRIMKTLVNLSDLPFADGAVGGRLEISNPERTLLESEPGGHGACGYRASNHRLLM